MCYNQNATSLLLKPKFIKNKKINYCLIKKIMILWFGELTAFLIVLDTRFSLARSSWSTWQSTRICELIYHNQNQIKTNNNNNLQRNEFFFLTYQNILMQRFKNRVIGFCCFTFRSLQQILIRIWNVFLIWFRYQNPFPP